MINSPYWRRYAQLLLDHSVKPNKGDYVMLQSTSNAQPLFAEIYRYLLELGAYPVLNLSWPEQEEIFYTYAQDHHIDQLSKFEEFRTYNLTGRIRILAPTNTRALSAIDPNKQLRHSKTMEPLITYATKNHRWVGCQYPTEALAQDAGMSLDKYTMFLFNSLHLDSENPAKVWQERKLRQEELIKRLTKANKIRIVAENTDLELSVAGRTWMNGFGQRNLPCGEIFTGPIEDSAEGHIFFNLPSSVDGREVKNIHLEFRQGEVVKASAEIGNEFLQARLNVDAGAKRLGEIGIGTNYRIQQATRSILFDEKIGGTVHLAIGRSYQESGGINQSAIHWDMICDLRKGGQIYLDGELVQENGKFLDYGLEF